MLLNIICKYRFLFVFLSRFYYLRGVLHIREQKLLTQYLKRHLAWSKQAPPSDIDNPSVRKNRTIWILWMQGMENAPQLVQKCYQSALLFQEDFDVVLLTKDNISQYVKLPGHVEALYQNGQMSEALHSDMVRLYLLIHYGGIWRDATCFQSTPYPAYVKESDFFMFSTDLLSSAHQPIVCSNWFIKAEAGNPLLVKTYNFLCEYHKRYSKPHNYYIFHLVLSVLVKNDNECKRIWNAMPYVCNMNPHVFFFSWNKPYDEKLYNHLLSSCFIHKLTYKYSMSLLKQERENMFQCFYRS